MASRDLFDAAAAFVADTTQRLTPKFPALSRAMRGLAADIPEKSASVRDSTGALFGELARQLDELRLSSSASSADVEQLSAALSCVALVGSAACSKCAAPAEAIALLDGALLRSRAELHTSLLSRAIEIVESAHTEKTPRLPTSCKRHHEDVWTDAEPGVEPSDVVGPHHHHVRSVAAGGGADDDDDALLQAAVRDANEPLLMRGLARAWPALERWSRPAYFRARPLGWRLVPIEVGAAHLGDARAADGSVCEQTVLRTLSDFVDEVVLGGCAATANGARPSAVSRSVPVTAASTRGYLAQHRLFEQIPQLAADMQPRPACLPADADCRAWFGAAHVCTPVHHDLHHGTLVQVVGMKRVLLWPPHARALLRAPPLGTPLANTSPLDPHAIDARVGAGGGARGDDEPRRCSSSSSGDGHDEPCSSSSKRRRSSGGGDQAGDMPEEKEGEEPESSAARISPRACGVPTLSAEEAARLREACTCVVLRPGDALLIPKGWWHHCTSLTISISVSFWWDEEDEV